MGNEIDIQATAAVSPAISQELLSTKKRFVVFLDIMGFKNRVARNEHDVILKQLEAFQNDISTFVSQYQAANIQVALFSDSILLFSNNDTLESLHQLADITSKIMMSAIQQQTPIPLKGAIALGIVTCDTSKQLYFGQALIDAYLLEENIKYYGVLVHHTAEASVKQLGGDEFRDIKACLKGGEISHYELNWYNTNVLGDNQISIEACLDNLRLTVSDEPRRYVDNTLKIYGATSN